MLDEPFYHRTPGFYTPGAVRHRDRDNFFADPFAGLNMMARPAVDVTQKGDKYILDVDLPGVSRDNLQVRLGDGNQSITIEGKVTEKSSSGVSDTGSEAQAAVKSDAMDAEYTDGMSIWSNHTVVVRDANVVGSNTASKSTSVKNNDNATQISVERPYTRNFSFSRTVWLPRAVDPNSVTAKLQNGVLSVTLNKAADETSKVVNIEEVV